MRKITADAVEAFRLRRNFKRGNTEVRAVKDKNGNPSILLILHGSVIAEGDYQSRLYLNTHGYKTALTKERLNGFHWVTIVQKNFKWFLNGEEWDGGRIRVRGFL
tara:strand:+ start:789 stop:1103 length:315 start_codon:yes stop_codon:yes gene_type:complete